VRTRPFLLPAVIGAVAVAIGGVRAATTSYTLNVTASVTSTVTLTAAPVSFPPLSAAAATSALSALTVTCTPGNALTIALDGGANALSGQRRLANGSYYVNYNLYQPTAAGNAQASPAIAWGNGGASAPGGTFGATCNGAAQVFNVYGQVSSGQSLFAGTYVDSVTVTVTY